jgi:branched-chain amino acid transport system permease protein
MELVDVIIQGMLLGGLYTIFAVGLSLIFGVMRLVNIAHGDFLVLAAYVGHMIVTSLGLNPWLALVILIPLMGGLGYLLQRFLLDRVMGDDTLPPLLVTFGLAIIIQNSLLAGFSTNSMRIQSGTLETASLNLFGIHAGILPLTTFGIAVTLIAGLELLFTYTKAGRAFRATSDDPEMAEAIGVKTRHVFALAMALCFITIAIAGVLLAMRSSFDPFSGPARLIYGFEAVIIGGVGSFWGTLAGGVILGVAQTLGAQISPQMQVLAGHIVFFVILAVRPRGLFFRTT